MFLLLSVHGLLSSQDCNFNYKSSVVLIPKDNVVSVYDTAKYLKQIEAYKYCISQTSDSNKLFWLNNSIARTFNILEISADSTTYYSLQAFRFNEQYFCQDFITVHLLHERNMNIPMKKHYVDVVNTKGLRQVRDYCIDNYRAAALNAHSDKEFEKNKELNTKQFNQSYFDELVKIDYDDQVGREQSDLDFRQKLDLLNRNKLDSLYQLYGFPTKLKVTSDGLHFSFIVLHHSTDCEWNGRWIERFLENYNDLKIQNMLSFYFYRNFKKGGNCSDSVELIEKLKKGKHSMLVKKLMDFTQWESN